MTRSLVDETVLDDVDTIQAGDRGGMLRAVATAGPQVREALVHAEEAGLRRLVTEGRPRAVVVTGVGGSGIAGDVLTACTGVACPVPVTVHKGFGLPGWVGPLDLVVAVSCSGGTEETLDGADEAARRGCRLVTVGATGSPLARLAEQAGAQHVPVATGGRPPRANLWALSVPLLVLADALGLTTVPTGLLERTAGLLDRIAARCGPATEITGNPAKTLAVQLSGTLPLVWGTGAIGDVAAYRLTSQLAENAKLPAVHGSLPEIGHNGIVVLDGPGAAAVSDDDFFRDRVDDPDESTRVSVLLLRDAVEDRRVAARRAAVQAVAEARDVPLHVLAAEGEHPFERLASVVAIGDFASVYLALVTGSDPTPIAAIDEVKERIRR